MSFLAVISSTSDPRIQQQQRTMTEFNMQRFQESQNIRPPREVSLRVKFIRLGEVSPDMCHSSLTLSLTDQGHYFTRKILCGSGH